MGKALVAYPTSLPARLQGANSEPVHRDLVRKSMENACMLHIGFPCKAWEQPSPRRSVSTYIG